MGFDYPQKILFKHCDPAGIVFFPRYFEMINDATEALFEEAFGCPWEVLHEAHNIPTAQIDTQFQAPSRHGDRLAIRVEVTRLGRSSLGLSFEARAGDELRFSARSTLVQIDKTGRAAAWETPLREKIQEFMET